MADKGQQVAAELRKKKVTTEIKRLEHQMSQQELQILEMDEQRARLEENIEASRREIEKQMANLTALESVVDVNG
ncbi:MAG TPA: hypothetical protein VFV92_11335 [Candidatus Bathyarchaeia archaeon]|nr:hypothetical protein [Candidatus Bathyarchaeia archaeon]